MWVTKLLISPVKKGFFAQKRPNLARNCWLIWCPVGGLAGGCGAGCISQDTYLLYFHEGSTVKKNAYCIHIFFLHISSLPRKSSWIQVVSLPAAHLGLQLVDVGPEVFDNGKQEVEGTLLPLLSSTAWLPPPAPWSRLPRCSWRSNCSSLTSTIMASAALLKKHFAKTWMIR